MIERILYNGHITTLNPPQKRVTALGITHGRIVVAGDDDEVLSYATAGTIKEDLQGHHVIPGLTDAHLHWEWTARALNEVDVFEVPSKEIALERVAERASQLPAGQWVTGQGWSQAFWQDSRFPTAADLDSVAPNHPVVLLAKSGHAIWVNSLAVQIAGLTAATSDPDGGTIGRDEQGGLTGILFETAMGLVRRHIPEISLEQTVENMQSAQKLALASGLTGFHDFDGPSCLRALQVLRERNELSLRVVKNINKEWIEHAHALGLRRGFGDDWIRIGGLKIFSDGALGPRTALMVDTYENEPNNYGVRVTDKEEMYELVSKASAAGLPSTIHAIGDLANREVLDVYEAVRKEEAARGELPSTRRHRIEHVQVLHPDDVSRFSELDIIASMQPIHATSDYDMSDKHWGERSLYAYNPRIQLDQGVHVAFGSDSPVDPFAPLNGIFAAVTRRRPDGTPAKEGWYPDARLSVEEAVRGFTTGAAYAAGMEDRLGQLAPGFLADLVLLDRDLFSISTDEILDVEVIGTMVDGKWRFGGV
ncbi:MAG: amidohydrolase [Aggregatilineales bacterium]